MDFFRAAGQDRRKTKLLVFYFAIAVVALIVAVYFATLIIFAGAQSHYHRYGQEAQFALWNPQLFLGVAGGVLAVVLIGSSYKTMALARGGSAVSEMMGGRPVNRMRPIPTNANCSTLWRNGHRLRRARAAGLCHGRGGRYQRLRRGHKPGDATVTVTRGCMKILSRDELQGVIGTNSAIFSTAICGSTCGSWEHFRNSLSGDHRANSFANRRGGGAGAARIPCSCSASCCSLSLHRRLFWTTHSSRRQPPARISRRRFVRPVHAQSGGITGALKKSAASAKRVRASARARRGAFAHVF